MDLCTVYTKNYLDTYQSKCECATKIIKISEHLFVSFCCAELDEDKAYYWSGCKYKVTSHEYDILYVCQNIQSSCVENNSIYSCPCWLPMKENDIQLVLNHKTCNCSASLPFKAHIKLGSVLNKELESMFTITHVTLLQQPHIRKLIII